MGVKEGLCKPSRRCWDWGAGPIFGGRTWAEGLGVLGEEGEVAFGLRCRWDIPTAVGRGQLGRWLWRRGDILVRSADWGGSMWPTGKTMVCLDKVTKQSVSGG